MSRISPPSNRVVAVLNLLGDHPQETFSLSRISDRLGLQKSTCHAILTSLTEAGFLFRSSADKTFTLGSALIRLGDAARIGFPILRQAEAEIRGLVRETGFGCWMGGLSGGWLTTFTVVPDDRNLPSPIQVGRVQFCPPYGAVLAAWRSPERTEAWIRTPPGGAGEAAVAPLRRMLKTIRSNGFGIWRLASPVGRVSQLYEQVISALGSEAATEDLRTTLTKLLMTTGGSAYSMTRLRKQDGGSVSYMIAPAFDGSGFAVFEVGLQVFRSSMSYSQIEKCSKRLLRVAQTITERIRGKPPRPDPAREST